jgi:hypothetical protein
MKVLNFAAGEPVIQEAARPSTREVCQERASRLMLVKMAPPLTATGHPAPGFRRLGAAHVAADLSRSLAPANSAAHPEGTKDE